MWVKYKLMDGSRNLSDCKQHGKAVEDTPYFATEGDKLFLINMVETYLP